MHFSIKNFVGIYYIVKVLMMDKNIRSDNDNEKPRVKKIDQPWLRILLIIGGSLSVSLGFIGLLLPVLPTTPFLLLAATCYARSSTRFYNWLLNNRIFGEHIRRYREKGIIEKKIKIRAIILLWFGILSTVIFFITFLWLRIALLVMALGVSFHIISIKSESEKK